MLNLKLKSVLLSLLKCFTDTNSLSLSDLTGSPKVSDCFKIKDIYSTTMKHCYALLINHLSLSVFRNCHQNNHSGGNRGGWEDHGEQRECGC